MHLAVLGRDERSPVLVPRPPRTCMLWSGGVRGPCVVDAPCLPARDMYALAKQDAWASGATHL